MKYSINTTEYCFEDRVLYLYSSFIITMISVYQVLRKSTVALLSFSLNVWW